MAGRRTGRLGSCCGSGEAASEYSPWRKPWVEDRRQRSPPHVCRLGCSFWALACRFRLQVDATVGSQRAFTSDIRSDVVIDANIDAGNDPRFGS